MRKVLEIDDNKLTATNIRVKLPIKRYEKFSGIYNIKFFGEDNLYPQKLRDLVHASPSASICYRRYKDFIFGAGIKGGDEAMVNYSQSLNDLLNEAADSVAMFGGVAFHLQFNAVGKVVGIHVLPFETIRLGEDDDFGYIRDYAYSPDWSECEITRNGKEVNNQTDIIRYLPYTDRADICVKRIADAKGVENYNGEVLYISNSRAYPISTADSVLADMSTEGGLQNIAYRNARCNFKPASIIVYKHGTEQANKRFEDTIKAMIGDESSSGVAVVKVSSFDDMPQSLELKTENYDDAYKTTTEVVQERIYAAYKQEPFYLIRTGHVGFGGDVESDAFNLMNISVKNERAVIERALKRIVKRWGGDRLPDIKIGDILYNKDESTTNTNANVTKKQEDDDDDSKG